MKKISSTLLLFALMSTSSYAQSCDDDTILSVSDDGSIVIMMSGAVFQVADPTEQVDTALWLVSDDVLICNDNAWVINKDEDGETASVRRLR